MFYSLSQQVLHGSFQAAHCSNLPMLGTSHPRSRPGKFLYNQPLHRFRSATRFQFIKVKHSLSSAPGKKVRDNRNRSFRPRSSERYRISTYMSISAFGHIDSQLPRIKDSILVGLGLHAELRDN